MRAWVLLGLLVAACGSTPKESYYTLAGPPVPLPVAAASSLSVYIAPVSVPDSVDRSPMVLRTGANEAAIDDMHRWIEPLKTAIPRAVAELLMRDLGTPRVLVGRSMSQVPADFRVAIDVQRFESSLTDGAMLDAAWTVTPAKGAPRNGRTLAREAVTSKDHAGVAAAHRRALETLSRDLAAAIR
ncbi:MAG: PqiC family protein [Usitatibacter sp.]